MTRLHPTSTRRDAILKLNLRKRGPGGCKRACVQVRPQDAQSNKEQNRYGINTIGICFFNNYFEYKCKVMNWSIKYSNNYRIFFFWFWQFCCVRSLGFLCFLLPSSSLLDDRARFINKRERTFKTAKMPPKKKKGKGKKKKKKDGNVWTLYFDSNLQISSFFLCLIMLSFLLL